MAKITVAGNAAVITSAIKLEDIKTIAKYRPNALVLKGGEDGKTPIFKIGVCEGSGSINKYGAEFGGETHDDAKLATITIVYDDMEGDIREVLADTVGIYVVTLNKLEGTLTGVLEEIRAEKQAVMDNITFA